jgi:hypothetical protein
MFFGNREFIRIFSDKFLLREALLNLREPIAAMAPLDIAVTNASERLVVAASSKRATVQEKEPRIVYFGEFDILLRDDIFSKSSSAHMAALPCP